MGAGNMLDIKIYKYEKPNYVEITGVLQGLPTHETVDDSLDTGSLIVNSETKDLFKLWQSIKLVLDGWTKYYVIADIQTKNRHVLSEDKYEHIISLIEPTKYLEKVVCSSMSFTNRTHTLKQQIERALLNAEPVEVGRNPRFRMSQALIDFLGNTSGEDFFFEKPLLREVLDTMLAVKNARCEVYEITDFNDIVIDYYDQTQLGKQISFVETDLVNRQTVQNIELLGSDIESYADNSFSENREPIWHPSPKGWDTFKTEEATLNTNNAVIQTAFPIEEIKSFIIKASFKLKVMKGSASYIPDNPTTMNLDIISNVMDSEAYSILLDQESPIDKYNYFTSENYKQNSIYYNKNNNELRIEKIKRLFFTTTNLENAIKNCIYKQNVHADWLANNPSYSEYTYLDDILLEGFSFNETLFRIQYIPYIDAHVNISKVNYTEVPSTLISNQSDKTIDLGRYGSNLYGQINRLGNKEITIDKMLNRMIEAYDVLDYTEDGYVVVERELAFYNEFIKAHYKLTKDFNNLSEKIGIDRKKRIYNIPLESFVRDILIKNYILVSTSELTDTSILVKEFLKIFDDGTRYPITNALVKTSGSYSKTIKVWTSTDDSKPYGVLATSGPSIPSKIYLPPAENYPLGTIGMVYGDALVEAYYIVVDSTTTLDSNLFELPVASYTMATSMMFKFKFMDNYSAGISTFGQVLGGKKQVPNPYVNGKGEYDSIRIRLFNDALATRAQDYDSVKLLPKVEESYYSNAVIPFNKEYQITKDAYEHHQFTMQLEIASNDPNVVIGFAFARLNGLITDKVSNLKLYVSTTEKYSVIDNQRPKGYLEPNQRITFTNMNYIIVDGDSFNNPQNIVSWGITDENNNLLVGVNSNVDRVYFGWRHQRV